MVHAQLFYWVSLGKQRTEYPPGCWEFWVFFQTKMTLVLAMLIGRRGMIPTPSLRTLTNTTLIRTSFQKSLLANINLVLYIIPLVGVFAQVLIWKTRKTFVPEVTQTLPMRNPAPAPWSQEQAGGNSVTYWRSNADFFAAYFGQQWQRPMRGH